MRGPRPSALPVTPPPPTTPPAAHAHRRPRLPRPPHPSGAPPLSRHPAPSSRTALPARFPGTGRFPPAARRAAPPGLGPSSLLSSPPPPAALRPCPSPALAAPRGSALGPSAAHPPVLGARWSVGREAVRGGPSAQEATVAQPLPRSRAEGRPLPQICRWGSARLVLCGQPCGCSA